MPFQGQPWSLPQERNSIAAGVQPGGLERPWGVPRHPPGSFHVPTPHEVLKALSRKGFAGVLVCVLRGLEHGQFNSWSIKKPALPLQGGRILVIMAEVDGVTSTFHE